MNLRNKNGSIDYIDDIENIIEVLDEEELRLINLVFNELDGFCQLTDSLKDALVYNKVSHYQFKKIFKSMIKVVYYKLSLNVPIQQRKSLGKTFFELPEIIYKKIELFIFRNTI